MKLKSNREINRFRRGPDVAGSSTDVERLVKRSLRPHAAGAVDPMQQARWTCIPKLGGRCPSCILVHIYFNTLRHRASMKKIFIDSGDPERKSGPLYAGPAVLSAWRRSGPVAPETPAISSSTTSSSLSDPLPRCAFPARTQPSQVAYLI